MSNTIVAKAILALGDLKEGIPMNFFSLSPMTNGNMPSDVDLTAETFLTASMFVGSDLRSKRDFAPTFKANLTNLPVPWIFLPAKLKIALMPIKVVLEDAFSDIPDNLLRMLRVWYPTRKANLDRAARSGPFLGIYFTYTETCGPLYITKGVYEL